MGYALGLLAQGHHRCKICDNCSSAQDGLEHSNKFPILILRYVFVSRAEIAGDTLLLFFASTDRMYRMYFLYYIYSNRMHTSTGSGLGMYQVYQSTKRCCIYHGVV